MPDATGEPELWTIAEAAAYLGIKPPSARGQLSRWKVKRYDTADSPNGRPTARYRADDVRAAASTRPGAGYRTDLRTAPRTGEPAAGDSVPR